MKFLNSLSVSRRFSCSVTSALKRGLPNGSPDTLMSGYVNVRGLVVADELNNLPYRCDISFKQNNWSLELGSLPGPIFGFL